MGSEQCWLLAMGSWSCLTCGSVLKISAHPSLPGPVRALRRPAADRLAARQLITSRWSAIWEFLTLNSQVGLKFGILYSRLGQAYCQVREQQRPSIAP
jgi:hypothetical protein